ncbi:hypothetical protein BJX70DRAFT_401926 [Aspergillus crustosus]
MSEISSTLPDAELHTLLHKHGLELTPDGNTAVSTAGSSAAEHAYEEFGIDRVLAIFIFVSLYLIGQAAGGVIFPATSETFGRKNLYLVSTGLYSAFCLIAGMVPSIAGVAVGRFLSGSVSAMPTIVAAGSLEDMFNSKARIWLFSFHSATLPPTYPAPILERAG